MIPRSPLSRSTIYGIWFYGRHETGPCFVGFLRRFVCGGGVRVGVAPEGDRRPGRVEEAFRHHVLVRMKAGAVLHASRGVDAGVIAGMVERAERTVREWPAEWRGTRMCWVPAGYAGKQDAAESARARKQELEAILARPPLPDGRPRRVPRRPGPAVTP